MTLLLKIAKPVLDFALPQRCPACGEITPDGFSFCPICWEKIRFMNRPWCESCALPFPFQQADGALCADCLSNPPMHDGIRAAVAYDSTSRQIALRLKYGGKIGLAKMIARHLVRHLPEDRSDIIIAPVPLHWTRLWSRSFNQSALIGRELARLGGTAYCADLLIRTKRTPSLRGLSLKERRTAVGTAFVANPARQKMIAGARLLLVDDVFTTGATSNGCVKALKKSGASWVQIFCWARALRGEALPENSFGSVRT